MKQLLFIFLLACVAWPWSKGAYQDGGMDKGAYQSLEDEAPEPTIDSISPIKGKRLSLDTIYVTNLPDSSATTEVRFNAVELNKAQQWSDGMVIDTIPSSMPRGYYTPRLFDGNDTLVVSGTRYRVLVPEIVKDGSN